MNQREARRVAYWESRGWDRRVMRHLTPAVIAGLHVVRKYMNRAYLEALTDSDIRDLASRLSQCDAALALEDEPKRGKKARAA
jgi:hypothetical protein